MNVNDPCFVLKLRIESFDYFLFYKFYANDLMIAVHVFKMSNKWTKTDLS